MSFLLSTSISGVKAIIIIAMYSIAGNSGMTVVVVTVDVVVDVDEVDDEVVDEVVEVLVVDDVDEIDDDVVVVMEVDVLEVVDVVGGAPKA